jgi:hypothetical protein
MDCKSSQKAGQSLQGWFKSPCCTLILKIKSSFQLATESTIDVCSDPDISSEWLKCPAGAGVYSCTRMMSILSIDISCPILVQLRFAVPGWCQFLL